jgi:hypothetical protein
LIKHLGRTLPEVAEITLPGTEVVAAAGIEREYIPSILSFSFHLMIVVAVEKVADLPQDRSSVDAELELSLDQLPFGVFSVYRARKLKVCFRLFYSFHILTYTFQAKFGRTRHTLVRVGELKAQFEVFRSKEEKKNGICLFL